MKRSDFRFIERLRVRWAEIDAQQIVFNAHYLTYIDTAMAGYWRALALPYAATMRSLGGDLFVRKATLDYQASARLDDVLDIGIRHGRIGRSSMQYIAAIYRGNSLLVSGELIYVFADPATQTSKPVPDALRDVLASFEAGAEMLDVRTGDWARLGADAHPIRRAVFVEEQGIPAEREWDAADPTAIHAVAYNRLGMAVGTGRLIDYAEGVGKIGRMAVVPAMRNGGVGRVLLDGLMDAARAATYREILLQAQRSATSFYRRAGFIERGEPYEEVGLPHIDMVRTL